MKLFHICGSCSSEKFKLCEISTEYFVYSRITGKQILLKLYHLPCSLYAKNFKMHMCIACRNGTVCNLFLCSAIIIMYIVLVAAEHSFVKMYHSLFNHCLLGEYLGCIRVGTVIKSLY